MSALRAVVDENIPLRTVAYLRGLGCVVTDPRGTDEEGAPDDALWRNAQRLGALVVTTDRGFAARRDEPHCGVLVVCLRQPNRERIHLRVVQALEQFNEDEWPGMTVVMRDRVQSVYRRPALELQDPG